MIHKDLPRIQRSLKRNVLRCIKIYVRRFQLDLSLEFVKISPVCWFRVRRMPDVTSGETHWVVVTIQHFSQLSYIQLNVNALVSIT